MREMNVLMKEYRGLLVTVIVVMMGLVVLLIYLYKDSRYLTEIKQELEVQNYKLNLDIKKSEVNEEKHRQEIHNKDLLITAMSKKIADAQVQYLQMKEALDTAAADIEKNAADIPPPCKQSHTRLQEDFNLAHVSVKENEAILGLYQQQNFRLHEVITRQEMAYIECREQYKLKEHALRETEAALARVDRYYKRKLFKKGHIKYTIGMLIGLAASFLLLKTKR